MQFFVDNFTAICAVIFMLVILDGARKAKRHLRDNEQRNSNPNNNRLR